MTDKFPTHPSGYPDINGEVIRLRETIAELEESWRKATAEADAWRFWAKGEHGSPLTSDGAAREHIDNGMRFVNQARTRLQGELLAATGRLAAVSRIVRRALACGQLEKLEDAKRYLDDEPSGCQHTRTHGGADVQRCVDCGMVTDVGAPQKPEGG